MHPFLNLNRAISQPFRPLMSFRFTSPRGISGGQYRSTAAFIFSFSKTNSSTFDFFVPRPSVSFVGKNAVVEGNAEAMLGSLSWSLGGGRERRRRSSGGRARRMVNDFTMNWPPKRRPFTSLLGLNDTSE
ncbi:hypothetical protein RJ640_009334, partial [Escallonia rubra]